MGPQDYAAIAKIIKKNSFSVFEGPQGLSELTLIMDPQGLVTDLADYFTQDSLQYGQHEAPCGVDYLCSCEGQFDRDQFTGACY